MSPPSAGDDNLCNVPHALPCSPAKRSKENRGRRLLFGDAAASPGKHGTPEKLSTPGKPPSTPEKPSTPGPSTPLRGQETPQSLGRSGDPARARLFRPEGECGRPGTGVPKVCVWGGGDTQPPLTLFFLFPCPNAGTCYQQAKRALHAAVPERLQGREREAGAIRQFLREHLGARRPGSLYISGAPGTGKTACLSCVLRDCQVLGPGSPREPRNFGGFGEGPAFGGEGGWGSFPGVLRAGGAMP